MIVSKEFSGNRVSGFHRGVVVKTGTNGKCKVWIPGVYDSCYFDDPDSLPDAVQASPLLGGGSKQSGTFVTPHKDSVVWCFFENEDISHPVYFAMSYMEDEMSDGYKNAVATDKEMSEAIAVGNCKMKFDEAGSFSLKTGDEDDSPSFSVEKDTIKIQAKSIILEIPAKSNDEHTSIRIDDTGITINSPKTLSIKGGETLNFYSPSNIELKSDNAIHYVTKLTNETEF